jgi:hypothetical protein
MALLTRTRTVTRTGFLIGGLCSLAIVASAWTATSVLSATEDNKDRPIPMAVYDTFKPIAGIPGSFAGVFTAIIGTDVASGTSRMDVVVTEGIARCKFTWVRSDGHGTLVLRSVCVLAHGHGTWHVESATGRYEGLKGVGTETFGNFPPGGPFTGFERFAGIGTADEHGDND